MSSRTAHLSLTLAALLAVGCTVLPTPANAAPQAMPEAVPVSTASPDFDGDGKADLAVTLDDNEEWSQITVRYGSGTTATGLGSAGALLARDLNGDGYTDLVAAHEDGAIGVLFGSASGLDATAEASFGASATGADFSPRALALVESPTPRLVLLSGRYDKPGKVVVYTLGSDGLPSAAPVVLRPGTGKMPSLGTTGSRYLESLAAQGNRLFVGAPFTTVSGHKSAGAVVVLTFGTAGVTSVTRITQATSGVGGSAAKSHLFGYSVAARDGYLAVGSRGDRVGTVTHSGSVQLFRLTSTKVTPVRRITQATSGVPGKAERGDLFGHAVALGTVCDGQAAVVVGGPGEAVADGHEGDGSVWIIPLKTSSTCPARQLWEGHGLPGVPTYDRLIGMDLAVLRDAGASADQVAIVGGGSYSEGPIGVLDVWSAQTLNSLASVEGFYDHPAGR
ncbi:MAG: VCBS repeat-containing protein [Propionicimonas sp.]|uniref:FG-GAP repeat domain-containing protein n=1 Tax=Propionicimonas sp. TaxID=1955623 RepID=UPI003D14D302